MQLLGIPVRLLLYTWIVISKNSPRRTLLRNLNLDLFRFLLSVGMTNKDFVLYGLII